MLMPLWVSIHFPQLLPAEAWAQPTTDAASFNTANSKVADHVVASLFAFTPRLAPLGPASLVLDVEASLKLFGGPLALSRCIRSSLQHVCPQQPAVISMAPTVLGAWVLAQPLHRRRRRYVKHRSLMLGLRTVSVHHLPAAGPHLAWLHSLGVNTLGKLMALPRAGLLQRTHPALGHQLDALAGKASVPLQWYAEPDTFHARIDLDAPLVSHAHILQGVQPLLQQLEHWLQSRQLAASGFTLRLYPSYATQEVASSSLPIHLSVPGWKVSDFKPVLTETLHFHRLPSEVTALALDQLQTLARPTHADSLFPDIHLVQRQENQLLDLLKARLGSRHILQPWAQACHLPEHANQWRPWAGSSSQNQGTAHLHPLSFPNLSRPFWMFDPALRLSSHHDQPVYGDQVLRIISGPERIESGWWLDGHTRQRDYFIAQDAWHRCYWVYHLRGSEHPTWFLHGLFA